MPTLAKQEAVEKLIQAVRGMSLDDLLDFHHEVFPEKPKAELDLPDGGAAIRQEIWLIRILRAPGLKKGKSDDSTCGCLHALQDGSSPVALGVTPQDVCG